MPTKIEWAEETWNPITGCTKVSEGCANCYAERMARRLAGRFGYPPAPDHFRVTVHEDKFDQPLRWKKPQCVFVCSMSDLFHQDVPDYAFGCVWATMMEANRLGLGHVFLLLTKRPGTMKHIVQPKKPLPNVRLGVTAENQKRADERIPVLLSIPAAGYFVSLEPMLGAVNLRHVHHDGVVEIDTLTGNHGVTRPLAGRSDKKLDWVILGGESGPGAKPMHPDWVRSVRDQCREAGVPFLFKQRGAWTSCCNPEGMVNGRYADAWLEANGRVAQRYSAQMQDYVPIWRVGKKRAGRLLDGELWDEYPEVMK